MVEFSPSAYMTDIQLSRLKRIPTERVERGDHQAGQPPAAFLRFPPPGLRMATAPLHGPLETMHTAFGTSRLVGQTSHTLRAVVTKTLENAQAFVR